MGEASTGKHDGDEEEEHEGPRERLEQWREIAGEANAGKRGRDSGETRMVMTPWEEEQEEPRRRWRC